MKLHDLSDIKIVPGDIQGYDFKIVDLGPLGAATWVWQPSLKPLILIDPRVFDIKFDSFEHKNTFLYDPFLGLLPHEYNEAMVTQQLVLGNLRQVKQSYPKYKFTKADERILNHTLSMEQLKIVASQDWKKQDDLVFSYGGIAHDVIISSDKLGYNAWMEKYDIQY